MKLQNFKSYKQWHITALVLAILVGEKVVSPKNWQEIQASDDTRDISEKVFDEGKSVEVDIS